MDIHFAGNKGLMQWQEMYMTSLKLSEQLAVDPGFKIMILKGCQQSLDWTTGLDYWTGLLDY